MREERTTKSRNRTKRIDEAVAGYATRIAAQPTSVSGTFTAAVAQNDTPPIDWLVENARSEDLKLMCKELLLAVDSACRDLQWDKLARLFLDWMATLEIAAEDKDGSLLQARDESRRGESLPLEEFCKSLDGAG